MSQRLLMFGAVAALCIGCSSKRASRDDAAINPIRDEIALVPAGWFSSGCYRLLASNNPRKSDLENSAADVGRIMRCVRDAPPRRLWLSSFEIDRFEVTQGDYQRCLDAGACQRPPYPPINWPKLNRNVAFPAVVTFEDARSFCEWRGKRLPTSAEWEKAARGIDDRIYPWGDTAPTCKHVDSAYNERDGFDLVDCDPHWIYAGGQRPAGASSYGIQDLIDNASEWVSDWSVGKGAEPSPDASFSADSIEEQTARATEALRHQKKRVDEKAIREAVENQPRPRFSRRVDDDRTVLEYDWSSLEFAWVDPSLVDPKGPPEPTAPGVHNHVIKGGRYSNWGIGGEASSGTGTDDTHRDYAGIRCARSVAGPPPPDVPSPARGALALPFREPGYHPPGTPTGEPQPTPAKAAKAP